jgi:hypothetical protein
MSKNMYNLYHTGKWTGNCYEVIGRQLIYFYPYLGKSRSSEMSGEAGVRTPSQIAEGADACPSGEIASAFSSQIRKSMRSQKGPPLMNWQIWLKNTKY